MRVNGMCKLGTMPMHDVSITTPGRYPLHAGCRQAEEGLGSAITGHLPGPAPGHTEAQESQQGGVCEHRAQVTGREASWFFIYFLEQPVFYSQFILLYFDLTRLIIDKTCLFLQFLRIY